jgi:membrane protein DedA with SNARE-associated domain
MTPAEMAAAAAPFVRIALYIVTGFFAGGALDNPTVDLIRTDPALLAALSGGIAALWYALARRKGWQR